MTDEGIDRKLWLALSESAFHKIERQPFFSRQLSRNKVSVLVVNVLTQTVFQWIP
jgi:hypothetical protein